MDSTFSKAEEAFRREVTGFIQEVIPRDASGRDETVFRRWDAALIARGWQAYKWRAERDGTGWTATQKYIWETQVGRFGLPTQLRGFGVSMIGPILGALGSADQRARFLPGILDGSVTWCQGYSEPGAGSDLASLRTHAVRQGDGYIVNGEKIWTSGAHRAQGMFALVRTSSRGRKQQGITFLFIDMTDPGVAVSPIVSIDGHHSLNRITLTDVRVAACDRVGEEDDGWSIAKGLLTHERTGLAFVAESLRKLRVADAAAAASELATDALFRRKLAAIEVELNTLAVTELRVLAESVDGAAPGVASSYLKLKGTAVVQRMTELLLENAGHYAMPYP